MAPQTDNSTVKQQIVEKIRQANNILVTVSADPTVDQLAACIGLTLLLNRMDKHATAVFSGQVPSTIEFLKPEETIESNTDSLRDFIISLDKEKADKLRYKVEDQVVRIFITPYKTSLSEKDLVFSQGDFNVEAVIALGIKDKAHIDSAITAHGKILHDSTVISLNAGQGKAPALGQLNWQEPSASSLCEMIVTISEAFGSGLIDNQMATAFLTGIVAETNRFSNQRTSARVMTISAQLMAAGANQQLIASKLEPPAPPAVSVRKAKPQETAPIKLNAVGEPEATPADGTLTIDHDKKQAAKAAQPATSDEIHIDEQGNIIMPGQAAPKQPELQPASKPPEEPPVPPPKPPTPPLKPPEPPPLPPSSHALLNPENQSNISGGGFTSTSMPEWQDPYSSVSIDPLSGAPAEPGLLEHNKDQTSQTVPTADHARSAVEEAYKTGPAEPAVHPAEALTSTSPPPAAPKLPQSTDGKSAPPPFPPPLAPSNGIVIPTPPAGS